MHANLYLHTLHWYWYLGNSSLYAWGLSKLQSGIRPASIIRYETRFIVRTGMETVSGRRDVQDWPRVHLSSFERLSRHFYAAGGLSKSIQLQSAGQLSALPPGCLCKVLMHSEAECCSAATHTGHSFRLLTTSFKRSKLFFCRKKNPKLFQSCSFKVKLQTSDLVNASFSHRAKRWHV